MAAKDITLWINEKWYEALSHHLKDETVEDKLNEYLDELVNQLPEKVYERISREIYDEDMREQTLKEEAKVYSVFRIRQDGQESLFSMDRNMDFLNVAVNLRSNLRDNTCSFSQRLTKLFPCETITQEEYQALVMKRLENTGKVAAAYHIDFDAGEFSALHIMDGWKTYSIKDISTAAYFATKSHDRNWLYRTHLFLERLEGKELTAPGIPLSVHGSRRLTADDISFSDEVIRDGAKLNFYLNCNFDVDAVFGTHVCTDENDDWLNVYAEYDIDSAQVDKHLILNLCRGDGTETVMVYDLNANEREILHNKMQEFCGQSLDDYAQSLCDEPTMELE